MNLDVYVVAAALGCLEPIGGVPAKAKGVIKLGFRVVIASTGSDAVDRCRSQWASDLRVHEVLAIEAMGIGELFSSDFRAKSQWLPMAITDEEGNGQPIGLTRAEALALAEWTQESQTAWGPTFDAAMRVAMKVKERLEGNGD